MRFVSALTARVAASGLALLFLPACGQDAPAKVEDLAARMCACADTACGEAVKSDYQSFTASNPSVGLDEAGQKRMASAIRQYLKCQKKTVTQPNLQSELGTAKPAPAEQIN